MLNVKICQEAKRRIPSGPWNYLVGGSENELALRRNRQAFQQWSFCPQVLVDVSQIDVASEFLGMKLRMPVLAAPVGGLTQFHKRGDLEWAKGLSDANLIGAVSGVARVEIDEIARETTAGLFYQLYFFGNDEWVKTRLQWAESLGYKAIVLTVDTAYYGQRERDLLAEYDARSAGWRTAPVPPDRERSHSFHWDEVKKIKTYTKLPLILKGVFQAQDVKRASEVGAAAIWISNHGGRQMDYTSASLDFLVKLAPMCHELGLSVIFDGGIRRGTEALLALCLGADVVALGRLPIYGLICDGAKGMKVVFDNFQEELKNAMGLLGLTHLKANLKDVSEKIIKENLSGFQTIWDDLEK